MIHWIIQNNLITNQEPWIRALTEAKESFQLINLDTANNALPSLKNDAPVFFYGSTELIKRVYQNNIWTLGVFFNLDNFSVGEWQLQYKDNLLNSDSFICSLKEVINKMNDHEVKFLRPNHDLKSFSGSIVTKQSVKDYLIKVDQGQYTFDSSIDVALSSIKHIQKEWRCFIVDKKVVSSSQYRLKTMIQLKEGCPPEVNEFAEAMANIWTPAQAFVMDIAQTNDGFKIIELNCINGSGTYLAPVLPIIQGINLLVSQNRLNPK